MPNNVESKKSQPAGGAPLGGNGTSRGRRSNVRQSSLNAACPHLGIAGDPLSNYAFPTPGNCCFQTSSPQAIPLQHQEAFCLEAGHTACPIFRNVTDAPGILRSQTPPRWRQFSAVLAGKLGQPAAKLASLLKSGIRSRGALTAALAVLLLAAVLNFGRQIVSAVGATLMVRAANVLPAQAPSVTATDRPTTAPSTTIEETTLRPSATLPSPIVVTRSQAVRGSRLPAEPVTNTVPSPTASPTALPPMASTATVSPSTPVAPTATPELANCGPPAGWVTYILQSGDNLFRLSLRFDASVALLRQANCLSSTNIYAGQTLFVPILQPAATATMAPTSSATPVPEATQ